MRSASLRNAPQAGSVVVSRLVVVTTLLERLLPLWTHPVDARDDTEAAFGEVYANPVVVNGTEMAITELAGRARSL